MHSPMLQLSHLILPAIIIFRMQIGAFEYVIWLNTGVFILKCARCWMQIDVHASDDVYTYEWAKAQWPLHSASLPHFLINGASYLAEFSVANNQIQWCRKARPFSPVLYGKTTIINFYFWLYVVWLQVILHTMKTIDSVVLVWITP